MVWRSGPGGLRFTGAWLPCCGAEPTGSGFCSGHSWMRPRDGLGRPSPKSRSRDPAVEVHSDSSSTEGDALDLQPEPLFLALLAWQRDATARGNHPVPGQSPVPLQRPDGDSRRAGESRGFGHLTIGDDLPPGYGGDHASKPLQRAQSSATTARDTNPPVQLLTWSRQRGVSQGPQPAVRPLRESIGCRGALPVR